MRYLKLINMWFKSISLVGLSVTDTLAQKILFSLVIESICDKNIVQNTWNPTQSDIAIE